MIALNDVFEQDELKKDELKHDEYPQYHTSKNASLSSKPHQPKRVVLATYKAARTLFYSSARKLSHANAVRKERKQDKLALQRLLQLDDALLKDMGIERRDLEAVKSGALTLDALNKYGIVAKRDNGSNTHFIWK